MSSILLIQEITQTSNNTLVLLLLGVSQGVSELYDAI